MLPSENQYQELYLLYYRQVYSLLYKLCHNSAVAERLSEEAFADAYRFLLLFDGRCSFACYVSTLAVRSFLRMLRCTTGTRFTIRLYVSDPSAPLWEDCGRYIQKETDARQLHEAVLGLPQRDVRMLLLKLYGGFDEKELARCFRVNPKAVSSICCRTQNQLKEVLLA